MTGLKGKGQVRSRLCEVRNKSGREREGLSSPFAVQGAGDARRGVDLSKTVDLVHVIIVRYTANVNFLIIKNL